MVLGFNLGGSFNYGLGLKWVKNAVDKFAACFLAGLSSKNLDRWIRDDWRNRSNGKAG